MDTKVNWLASARLKFGWVPAPDWLIYGTGGLGIAHVEETVSQSVSGGTIVNGTTVFTGDDTMLGWTAGAGIDWKWRRAGGSAWVFGIEYLHYGFPNRTVTLSGPNPLPPMQIGIKEDIDVIKGRISYFWPLSP